MSSAGSGQQRITLEDLAALNREMSALVRSGLPLEAGLRQVAQDFRGGASRLAARLAEETAAGKTLAEAIAAQGDSLPAAYRAVVEAGLKTGRLGAALEGYAETAARMAALRRIAAQAFVYPVLVLIVAWLMLLLAMGVLPESYEQVELGDLWWFSTWRPSSALLWTLAGVVPAAIIIVAFLWWRQSATPAAGRLSRPLRWIPGARRAVLLSGQANFADLLRTMLISNVPLNEALPLAASASGAAALREPARELAAQITAGHSLQSRVPAMRALPPLVRTALLTGRDEASVIAGLQRARDSYRERAATWLANVSVFLPVGITLGLGVGVVGLYAVLVLQPYFATLHELSGWSWR